MPVIRTIDVPDRYFAILNGFGQEATGPAGVNPFDQMQWIFRLNGAPFPPYGDIRNQIGGIEEPTRIPQPIICPPKSRFTVEFNVLAGAPAGLYRGQVRIVGYLYPVREYLTSRVPDQFARGF